MNTVFTDTLGHFAWCAQIALGIARQDQNITPLFQEHIFLMNWLKTARKQKRFPKEIAADIDYLIAEGTRSGQLAGLKRKLTWMYKSTSENIQEQSDLFRLTYAVELLKNEGWGSHLLSSGDWKKSWTAAHTPALYMSRDSLKAAFNEEGEQITALDIRIEGDLSPVEAVFSRYQLLKRDHWARNGILTLTVAEQVTGSQSV